MYVQIHLGDGVPREELSVPTGLTDLYKLAYLSIVPQCAFFVQRV